MVPHDAGKAGHDHHDGGRRLDRPVAGRARGRLRRRRRRARSRGIGRPRRRLVARRAARRDGVLGHVASSIGFQPFYDPTALETTTPLLHAGDRRFWEHELMGPLGDTGLTARLAQYRYDVKEGEGDKGQGRYASHRYTICLIDMPDSMALFPGVYLREDRNLLSGHDWLRGRGLREVELESTDFCDAYDLQVAREQDDGRLRELFDPKTIVWLSEHPMRPHIELRAGFLVVYVPGFIEDLGRVIWLLEAAERIAERVQAEVGEVVG
jgi:hypothetical protein